MKIAIIDTGTFYHDFFLDKFVNITGDDIGHGSQVAYLILKENPNSEILSYKCDNSKGLSITKVISAINDAINRKVNIILIPSGSINYNDVLHETLLKAYNNNNIIIVCASGNNPQNVYYPSEFDFTISVGSIDKNRNISKFSSKADYYECGENILSIWKNNSFTYVNGTSFACAIFCGKLSVKIEEIVNNTGKYPNKNQLKKILREMNNYEKN